eukprot:403351037
MKKYVSIAVLALLGLVDAHTMVSTNGKLNTYDQKLYEQGFIQRKLVYKNEQSTDRHTYNGIPVDYTSSKVSRASYNRNPNEKIPVDVKKSTGHVHSGAHYKKHQKKDRSRSRDQVVEVQTDNIQVTNWKAEHQLDNYRNGNPYSTRQYKEMQKDKHEDGQAVYKNGNPYSTQHYREMDLPRPTDDDDHDLEYEMTVQNSGHKKERSANLPDPSFKYDHSNYNPIIRPIGPEINKDQKTEPIGPEVSKDHKTEPIGPEKKNSGKKSGHKHGANHKHHNETYPTVPEVNENSKQSSVDVSKFPLGPAGPVNVEPKPVQDDKKQDEQVPVVVVNPTPSSSSDDAKVEKKPTEEKKKDAKWWKDDDDYPFFTDFHSNN